MKEKGYGSLKVLGMKVLPFYLFAFLLLILTGCIEEYEADISENDSDLLVVEGTICSGEWNTFFLSRTMPLHSANEADIAYSRYYPGMYDMPGIVYRATVSVRGSDGSEIMAQGDGGYYGCWIDNLDPNVKYYLHIEVDGDVYESEPQKPLRTEKIADVRGVQNTPESPIDVLVTPEAPFDPDKANYYSWTYDETWEVHPDYVTEMSLDINKMEPVYNPNQFPKRGWKNATSTSIMVGASSSYDGQHIQRLKIYDLDRSNERVHHRYSGLLHQRAITKAEYEYHLARVQASSEMGGLFTPQPSALPTNIRCLTSPTHVIGYVGCSLNTTDYRFFLDAKDFTVYIPPVEDARIWFEKTTIQDCLLMLKRDYYLCYWEDNRMGGGALKTAWAPERLLDVRYKGAYIDEPDFWSLEGNVSY